MRRAILLLLAAAVAGVACRGAGAAARRAPARIAPKEVILGWINQYRHHPEPEQAPLAVRGLSRLGILTDTEGAGVYVGFLAGIFAHNPDKADALIAQMFPLSGEHHWAIVRAIAYSGLPDWRTVLQRNAERMPARRVMIEKFLAGKLPTLDQAPIEKDETLARTRARPDAVRRITSASPRRSSGWISPPTCSTRCGAISTRPATTARSRASS